MIQLQDRREPAPFSLFNLAFRPFFLGGALVSVCLMAAWLITYSNGLQPHYYSYGVLWHAHEMIFGFTLAIIAGFLLTAVRNWTNVQTLYGWPLAALFCLWLSARLMPLFPALSPTVIAVSDLAFAPLLAISVAWPILKSKNYRNLMFIPLLTGFFIANLMMHLQFLGVTEHSANSGMQLGLFLVVMVMTIIGGRVIPFFTERGVAGVQCRKHAWLEKVIIPATATWLLLSLLQLPLLSAVLSLLLGGINLLRIAGWFDRRILSTPLVWILHIGYLFIGLGLVLYGLSQFEWVSRSVAFHAFAAGGIGSLTLGMMSRVSLGHTARPLVIGPVMIAAFVLIVLAGIIRVSVGLLPLPYLASLHLSGSLWSLAWILFAVKYASILIRPRLDGVYG